MGTCEPPRRPAALNPLSTRCVRPGALAYQFAPGPRLRQLLGRLCDTGGWGQIIGPHGSGKSTLLHTLWPALAAADFDPLLFTLRDRQRRLPAGWRREAAAMAGRRRLVVIDGYEQLSVPARWKVQRTCRRQRWGLLITAHQPQGLPMLYRTRTTPELAQALVQQLLEDQPLTLAAAEIDNSFHRHRGNLRDVFMELFDRYEQLRG
jgi:hypothetical protein